VSINYIDRSQHANHYTTPPPDDVHWDELIFS